MVSVNQLDHYYEGSDSCHRHLDGRSPHLLQLTFLAFRSQPLGRLSYRFNRQNNVTNDFQASSLTRRLAALPCRIGFVIPHDYAQGRLYGLPFRFQLLSTPFRNDAVTFSYDVMAYADRDFHPVDKLPLWAHGRRQRLGRLAYSLGFSLLLAIEISHG